MAGNVTERTIEKGPLSSHSSLADPALTACHSNPLKVSVACYTLQPLRRTRPNVPLPVFTLTFSSPPSLLLPSEVIRGGISQKEMPELWRRCLRSQSFFPPLLLPWSWVLSLLCNGVLGADNRMSEEITCATLLLLWFFLAKTVP